MAGSGEGDEHHCSFRSHTQLANRSASRCASVKSPSVTTIALPPTVGESIHWYLHTNDQRFSAPTSLIPLCTCGLHETVTAAATHPTPIEQSSTPLPAPAPSLTSIPAAAAAAADTSNNTASAAETKRGPIGSARLAEGARDSRRPTASDHGGSADSMRRGCQSSGIARQAIVGLHSPCTKHVEL